MSEPILQYRARGAIETDWKWKDVPAEGLRTPRAIGGDYELGSVFISSLDMSDDRHFDMEIRLKPVEVFEPGYYIDMSATDEVREEMYGPNTPRTVAWFDEEPWPFDSGWVRVNVTDRNF